jgi:Zn-dependent M28 family amino/carboxypeptidase
VYFVLFDAEEQGLLGSLHFVAHPPRPVERCAGMVNMDMVGRAVKGRLQVYGAGSGSGLADLVRAENEAVGLTLSFQDYMTPNSDHFAFYRARVATVHLFTGIHRDYHRAGDDAHKVNYADLERVARLAFRVTLGLADADAAPVFAEVPLPPPGEMIAMILESFVGPGVGERVRKLIFGDKDEEPRRREEPRREPRPPSRERRLF